MKLPVSWLREFVEIKVEPRKLGDDLTMVGLALDGIETDGKDAVLDIDVTTNRVDCMNVYGIAREVAVVYGLPLRPVPADVAEAGDPAERALDVKIEAADLCPRFCARVLDVRIGPSPAWLRERLELVGVRPINNVVDLTNYVMLELGQPTHAFDLAKLPRATLLARWGNVGEHLKTLDGVDRRLPSAPRVGLVASPAGPLAIAGVMGGAASEVGDATAVVALEAAYWDPLSIRRAAKALGMHTEASHRFERGADVEAPPLATARIAHLLQKLGAGSARPGTIDRAAAPRLRPSAPLRSRRVSAVLGAEVPEARGESILRGLGFEVGAAQAGVREVGIPSWRQDVSREADLVEEIGRHFGLGRIAPTLPGGLISGGLKRSQLRERRIRQALQAAGLDEVITLSFEPDAFDVAANGAAARLLNPLAEDQGVLRQSLVNPGLLVSLRTNLRQGRKDVHLFEMGRTFRRSAGQVAEERRLGVLLSGQARAAHWSEPGRAVDFFDLRGILDALCERLELPPFELVRDTQVPELHPGQSATLHFGGKPIGFAGALHPDLARRAELPDGIYVAELLLEPLLAAGRTATRMRPIPRQPAVSRDLSLVFAAGRDSAALVRAARGAGGGLLRAVTVTDRYEGAPVPAGSVSLLLSLLYQDDTRTLTSEEVDESVARVKVALRESGAEIRGG